MMSDTELLPFPDDWDRALAIAAHPDDLEYGVASAAAAWTEAGKSVAYVLATNGAAGIDGMDPERAGPLREDEERAGAREVGVEAVEFLGHADGVVEYGLPLRRDVACHSTASARPDRDDQPCRQLARRTPQHGRSPNVGWRPSTPAQRRQSLGVHRVARRGLEPWLGARRIAGQRRAGRTDPCGRRVGHDRTGRGLPGAHAAYLAGLGQGPDDADSTVRGIAETAGQRFGGRPAVAFELMSW